MSLAAWSALEPGLTAIFAAASGIPAASSGARDGQFRFKSSGRGVRLDWTLISTRGIGRDELRFAYDPDIAIGGDEYAPPGGSVGDLGGFVETMTGNRALVIQVMVESDRHSDGGARYAVEALRDRLYLPEFKRQLLDLGLALAWAGPAIDVGRGAEDEGGRPPSLYAIELECNASSAVSGTPITTIETVEVIGEIATDVTPFGP